jgi:hypothetical protein
VTKLDKELRGGRPIAYRTIYGRLKGRNCSANLFVVEISLLVIENVTGKTSGSFGAVL